MERKKLVLPTFVVISALLFSSCASAQKKAVSQEQPPVPSAELTGLYPVSLLCLARTDIPINVGESHSILFSKFGQTTFGADHKNPVITIFNNDIPGFINEGQYSRAQIETATQIIAETHELFHACVESTREMTMGGLKKAGIKHPDFTFLPDNKIIEIEGFTIKLKQGNEDQYYKGIDDVLNGFLVIETLEKNPQLTQGIDMGLYKTIVYNSRLPELIERWNIVKSDELIKKILEAKKTSDISSLISSLYDAYHLAGFTEEEFFKDLNVYLSQEY
jgi:hypothetical protein